MRAEGWASFALSLLFLLAVALGTVSPQSASAAEPTVDEIVVKLRDDIAFDRAAGLPSEQQAALSAALQLPFSLVGYAPDGALRLQFMPPLRLGAARAAANRARLLEQVVYVDIVSGAHNARAAIASLPQAVDAAAVSSSAKFVPGDSSMRGNWRGAYGSEGYAILNESVNYPSYVTVTPSGKADYIWAAQPDSDVRALQRGASSGRIAACWYSTGQSFTIDINFSDAATHRVSFYLLDWDTNQQRSTQIDIIDPATQVTLSSIGLSAFNAGHYLTWDLRGHVVMRFTSDGAYNAVLSGIFFDQVGYELSGTVTAGGSPLGGVGISAPGGGRCSDSDGAGHYSCIVPEGWSGSVTPTLAGYGFTPASRSYANVMADQVSQNYTATAAADVTSTVLSTFDNPANAGQTVRFTATVTGMNPTGNVSFTDNGAPIPACSAVALTGSGNVRTAACSTSSLTGGSHAIVAAYGGDASNSSSISAPLTQLMRLVPSASYVGADSATRGNWKGVYGAEGYAILNDSIGLPAYATIGASGKADYVWDAQPNSDARALQRGVSAGRIAACWYSLGQSFDVDINLTDESAHRVSFYLLDWDTNNQRSMGVEVRDANTMGVLAVTGFSAFTGTYVTFELRGHVIVRFINHSQYNAVLSGIFFDSATPKYTLSGTVAAGPSPLLGVGMDAFFPANCSGTDSAGHYFCTVPQGWSGTITPLLDNYTFNPASRSYSNVAADQSGQDYSATAILFVTTTTLSSSANPATAGSSITYTATVNGDNPTGTVSFIASSGPLANCGAVALVGSGNSKTAECTVNTLGAGTHNISAIYSGDAINLGSQNEPPLWQQIIVIPAATFVTLDTTTQGNWRGRYGADGYAVLGESTSYPSYATVAPSGKADYVWAAQADSDPRALQRGLTSGRIAACWYSPGTTFSIDLNLADSATHRVAFYLLDWDTTLRAVQIDVLDANTQQVLSTRTVSNLNSGVYAVWDLRGHVKLRFTSVGSYNAVLSGIFFN